LSQFIEQPRVLDDDNSLSGEVLDEFNLFVGEWTNFLAVDDDRPISSSFLSIGTPR
jgi:hypothetical protein